MDHAVRTHGDCLLFDLEGGASLKKTSPQPIFPSALFQFSVVSRFFWSPKPFIGHGGDPSTVGHDFGMRDSVSQNQSLGFCFDGSLFALGKFCFCFERDHLVVKSIKKANLNFRLASMGLATFTP